MISRLPRAWCTGAVANWRVAWHGRSDLILATGTSTRNGRGVFLKTDKEAPSGCPCQRSRWNCEDTKPPTSNSRIGRAHYTRRHPRAYLSHMGLSLSDCQYLIAHSIIVATPGNWEGLANPLVHEPEVTPDETLTKSRDTEVQRSEGRVEADAAGSALESQLTHKGLRIKHKVAGCAHSKPSWLR
jgi:hypothetical protein